MKILKINTTHLIRDLLKGIKIGIIFFLSFHLASCMTVAPRKSFSGYLEISWPVPLGSKISQKYKSYGKKHLGLDLTAKKGTPILAAHNGYVEYTGRDFSGYGKMIIINSQKGWSTFYAHLDSILVREGQRVFRTQKIGTMGRTGRTTGVHLHFELRQKTIAVNPLKYLP